MDRIKSKKLELFWLGLHLTPLGKLTWNLDRLKRQNLVSSGSTMTCRPNRTPDSPTFLLYLPKSFFPKVWGRAAFKPIKANRTDLLRSNFVCAVSLYRLEKKQIVSWEGGQFLSTVTTKNVTFLK